MSNRVTIRQLMYECTQPMHPDDYAKMQKILDTEITPRRAIEMIIERIKVNKSACVPDSYAEYTLDNVLHYAESLLKQFEKDK